MATKENSENKTKTNERYEKFKTDILNWKKSHAEEYNRFARAMRSGEANHYFRLYKFLMAKTPSLVKEWEKRFDDESPEVIDDFTILVKESSFPAEIVSMFESQKEEPVLEDKPSFFDRFLKILGIKRQPKIKISAPLLLSWLYYGKSFEAVADMMNSLVGIKKAHPIEKEKCSLLTKRLIDTSIKYGYRTEEDWDKYFESKKAIQTGDIGELALNEYKKESQPYLKEEKSFNEESDIRNPEQSVPVETVRSIIEEYQSQTSGRRKAEEKPFIEYLSTPYKDDVLKVLRNYILTHNTGLGIAISYYALQQLELFKGAVQSKEFSTALSEHFSDIPNLIKPNSIRQAISELKKNQPFVMIEGKNQPGTLLQSDEWAPVLEELKNKVSNVIETK